MSDRIDELFNEVRTSTHPDESRRRIAPLLTNAIAEQQAIWLETQASRRKG